MTREYKRQATHRYSYEEGREAIDGERRQVIDERRNVNNGDPIWKTRDESIHRHFDQRRDFNDNRRYNDDDERRKTQDGGKSIFLYNYFIHYFVCKPYNMVPTLSLDRLTQNSFKLF